MIMLKAVEVKAFLPAKDFEKSLLFYQDIGFTLASNKQGVAYFHHGDCSFLLQNHYQKEFAENLMMHLLVENVDAWHRSLISRKIVEHYAVTLSTVQQQPWGMRDFTLSDPSGVLWRVAEND